MEQETATHFVSKFYKIMEICILSNQYYSIWSGNKETDESEREKGEAAKTIVEDCKIVKDDQDYIFVHEPQSFNKTTEDEKIILSDVTLEKKKEDDITGKPEEVFG